VSVRRELQQMLRSPLLMTEYGGRYPTMLGHLPEPVLRPGQAKNNYNSLLGIRDILVRIRTSD
jgi:hypothetical protein